MSPETVYTVISIILIPAIVGWMRKVNLPSKWAPVAAFGVGTVLVGAGKLFGVELDVNTIADLITRGLVTAGVSVIGYDQVKKLTEPVK